MEFGSIFIHAPQLPENNRQNNEITGVVIVAAAGWRRIH